MGWPVLTRQEAAWVAQLVQSGQEHAFYCWSKWKKCRRMVIAFDRHECVLCRAKGRYRRAEIVHHVRHLKHAPSLALSLWQEDGKTRQLISVCKACHEAEHPEALRRFERAQSVEDRFTSVERWD